MNYSAKIVLRKPPRQDGTCLLRLQVIINRALCPIGLGISWWPELFDESKGICVASLPAAGRPKNYRAVLAQARAVVGIAIEEDALAKRAADYNLLIGQALGRANEVLVQYRLSKKPLTVEAFLEDYNSASSKTDFLAFFQKKLAQRLKRKQIAETTHISHQSTLRLLRAFRDPIPFYSLCPQFVEEFHAFVQQQSKSPNTWWGRHKTVKAYLALARKAKIKFEDPYQDFQNKSVRGSWKALPPAELAVLEKHYAACVPCSVERRVLQKFLFSCYSSLRLSDLKAVDQATFSGREMTFRIKKTYSKKLRDMMLPLTSRALGYLEDARRENELPGFYDYADQYSNRVLQRLAQQLGVSTHLHHHVGRETFATNFIRLGGKVEVLQKLLDHENIQTTMKYVHVDDDMKRAAIQMLEAVQSR
ncbi:MAG: tyrosine-type recombinase/integrase [Janthinobacterium lividum]